ncbi:MAG: peptidoglycan-binding domain-containing protein [Christensenellales bacterium]
MKRATLSIAVLLSVLLLLPAPLTAEVLGTNSSGEAVHRLQQRLFDLDYFNYKPTANYGSMTRSAVMKFQEYNGLPADGIAGEQTLSVLFAASAKRKPITGSIPFGLTEGAGTTGGADVDWKEVNALFASGTAVTVTDFITGKSFSVRRTGGTNHAVVRPVSAADEQTYLEVFGGTPNWSKRAAVVVVDGRRIAASMAGMPRGEGAWSSNDDLSGGFDLYFAGSTADFCSLADAEHTANIKKATI